jgi:ubiquinone/menaquinone biosynthesis C-methylase UbiE
MKKNIDKSTVDSFGDEWGRFNQSNLPVAEAQKIFNQYFEIFPWDSLPDNAEGFDLGCGSGRWAKIMIKRVGHLHCIDPSDAIEIARKSLSEFPNVSFYKKSVDEFSLPINSQDFGYSLGVLHHVPDTAAAVKECASLLKPGAPFLMYLYYALENTSFFYRTLWKCSDFLRKIICQLPSSLKHILTDIIAIIVYFPLAKFSLLVEKTGIKVSSIPLSFYRNCSFYTMRTDSRDRFGTPLEQRFTQAEIKSFMHDAGFKNITFNNSEPRWCVVGIKS